MFSFIANISVKGRLNFVLSLDTGLFMTIKITKKLKKSASTLEDINSEERRTY
jgi:hypothetical protein